MDVTPRDKHWIKRKFDGFGLYSMVFVGIQWYSMVFIGIHRDHRDSQGFLGINWYSMVLMVIAVI